MSDKFWETLFNPKTLLITNVTMFFNIFQYMFLYFTCPFFRWQTKEISKHSFLSKHIHLGRTGKKKAFLKWDHPFACIFHSQSRNPARHHTNAQCAPGWNPPMFGRSEHQRLMRWAPGVLLLSPRKNLVTYVGNGVGGVLLWVWLFCPSCCSWCSCFFVLCGRG